MRTNIDATVTNCTVFGFGQDRAVATRVDGTCAYAAQHLTLWHASKRSRWSSRLLKRADLAVEAGAALMVQAMCLAIMGPGRPPVRPVVSPVLVVA
jgi:hypothetical protein